MRALITGITGFAGSHLAEFLLAEHPAGLTAEQLAVALYGDRAKPVSARAEVSRLRTFLGTRIGTEPYRLEPPVESDIGALRRLLRQGRPDPLPEAAQRQPPELDADDKLDQEHTGEVERIGSAERRYEPGSGLQGREAGPAG